MPRPDQAPAQRYRGLGYGTSDAANAPIPDFTPTTPEDQFLYAPTDQPDVPFTNGMPFGPGAGVYVPPKLSAAEQRKQIGGQLLNSQFAGDGLKRLAKRILAGD